MRYRLFNTSKQWKIISIGPSHFCEKIRWCLQYSGIEFHEIFDAGILGVFLFQRTVPVLIIPRKRLSIGNSSDILRYVYGHVCGHANFSDKVRKFLEPTPEAVELEKKFDEIGTAFQVVLYNELFKSKKKTLQAWLGLKPDGNYSNKIPLYQCILTNLLYPAFVMFMKKGLKITPSNVEKQMALIRDGVKIVEERLSSGRKYILGTESPTFIDFTFASLYSHLLVDREAFANGLCREFLLTEQEKQSMKLYQFSLELQHTKAGEFVKRMYQEHRTEVFEKPNNIRNLK